MKDKMANLVPKFFEKPIDDELNPIRLLYNNKKYKYYLVTTYNDTYQAYLNPDQFHASGRLPFEFDNVIRAFTVEKSFKQFKNHGLNYWLSFSTISDHHTIHDWIACKDWLPLALIHQNREKETKVDEYLTITRRWIDDSY